eukprot:COSAG01_NODE_37364_length_504_cov_2.227160_2_plen_80_part_01
MKKNAIITGANRGIGLELAKQLKAQNYDITAICRTSNPELDQLAIQVISNIDIRNTADIQTAAKQCQHKTIDLLINNAGI